MLYQTLAAFEDYVHEESCVLLSHKECACCGTDMEDRPYGVFGVSMTYKPAPEADRLYFPLYHLVCKGCFDIMHFALRLKEDIDSFIDPKNQPNQPKWSQIWALSLKHRPSDLSRLEDEEYLCDLFFHMAEATSPWEDFSEVANCETMADFLGLS